MNENHNIVTQDNTKKRPTLQTVADYAGVSKETVSHILGGRGADRYNSETQRRVREAAKKLNYRPNRAAQLMRKGKSGVIAIVNFGYSSLQQRKIVAAAREILKEKYDPVVYDVLWFADRGEGICHRLLDARVEGVLLVHPNLWFTQRHLDMLLDGGIPVVAFGGSHLSGIVNFMSDKRQGFRDLTRYLLGVGYRRLAYLGSYDGQGKRHLKRCWHLRNAIAGIEDAIREFGQGNCSMHVYPRMDIHEYERHPYLPSKRAMQDILSKSILPEVVLCSNDIWAQGALAACAEADVRVPEDMALVGFENMPESEAGTVPLTTMHHPVEEMTHQGVESLITQVRSGIRSEEKMTVLPCRLVVRRSCGAYLRNPVKTALPAVAARITS